MTNTLERSPDTAGANVVHSTKIEMPLLTRNQGMIYDTLLRLNRAAKAYELIDELRPQGVKAAPTVYRALHELEEKGLVKHLVASRSFYAFKKPACPQTQNIATICSDCGNTHFFEDEPVMSALQSNAHKAGFTVRDYHIELSTYCCGCAKKPELPS